MTSGKYGQLLAGAAKVDVTSPDNALPAGYKTVHDHVYARAIVLDNQVEKAVLVTADVVVFGEPAYQRVVQQISQAVGCPKENILISSTHTHASPAPGPRIPPGAKSNSYMNYDEAYSYRITDGILEAVVQAKAKLQPARMGYGTGLFHANVNRDAIHPETRTWTQGPNTDAPSDKTVAVTKFETQDGKLIAVYVNYAMHANLMYMRHEIGAGFPGAMSRYIEEVYDEEAVALWTAGAGGDQNPLYMRYAEPAILKMKREKWVATGGDPMDIKAIARFDIGELDPVILDRNIKVINAIGLLLGEEVIRVMENTHRTHSTIRIWGTHQSLQCPGRKRLDNGREGTPGVYEDTDPVDIRMGLLMIGQVAFVAIAAEPYNIIGQRIKRLSPYGNTVIVSLANGQTVGYIPDDASYQRYTFQVLSSRIKQGCAEQGIITTALDMMDKSLSC